MTDDLELRLENVEDVVSTDEYDEIESMIQNGEWDEADDKLEEIENERQ